MEKMDETRELFADGVGEINLSGGMVRMDLVALVGSKRDGNEARFETRQRIVMPPDGFLKSFSAMEDLVKQLIDAGLVKPRDQQDPTTTASVPADKTPPSSPNFST